jgi:hypothetical protein
MPIKIAGFSGGCKTVRNDDGGVALLTHIGHLAYVLGDATNSNQLSHLAYLGLQCVNIACPPVLITEDTLGSLAEFLDANLTQVGRYRGATLGDLTASAVSVTTARKAGIASAIAGCGCCS